MGQAGEWRRGEASAQWAHAARGVARGGTPKRLTGPTGAPHATGRPPREHATSRRRASCRAGRITGNFSANCCNSDGVPNGTPDLRKIPFTRAFRAAASPSCCSSAPPVLRCAPYGPFFFRESNWSISANASATAPFAARYRMVTLLGARRNGGGLASRRPRARHSSCLEADPLGQP